MKEYFETILGEILVNIILEIIYVLSALYYLSELRTFNDSVKNVTSSVDIMFKDNGKAWYLLIFALLFTLIAGGLMWYHCKEFSRKSGYSMLTLIIFMLILFMFVVTIFNDIDNPILKAAIVVIFGGSIVFTALGSSELA